MCLSVCFEDSNGDWNEHKVELTLWTFVTASKLAPELLQENKSNTKRKGEERDSDERDSVKKDSKKVKKS
jgi:hypothetical protein